MFRWRKQGTWSQPFNWTENWIPDTVSMRPLGRLTEHGPTRVGELIDQHTFDWNEELLRSVAVAANGRIFYHVFFH
jgi:hypothetical protein